MLRLNQSVSASSGTLVNTNTGFFDGRFAIDTTYIPADYSLAVNGSIIAEQVDVVLSESWPDYVFDKSHKLPTLEETATFIDSNRHLPGMPSAKDMESGGVINVGKLNIQLLEKVEELTLYLIEQNERLKKSSRREQAALRTYRKTGKRMTRYFSLGILCFFS